MAVRYVQTRSVAVLEARRAAEQHARNSLDPVRASWVRCIEVHDDGCPGKAGDTFDHGTVITINGPGSDRIL
jgi:hypothetical protein